MGLDIVELVMTVENRFGVRLSDPECTRIGTVADLAALVISKLPGPPTNCLSARTFYDVRGLLVSQCGIERRSVRPATRFAELFQDRQQVEWPKLCLTNDKIPPLVVSPGLDVALCFGSAMLVCTGMVGIPILVKYMGGAVGLGVGLGVLAAVGTAFALTQNWLRRHPPYNIATVGDLARFLAPIRPPEDDPGQWPARQQEVLDEIRRITASGLRIPIEQVHAHSHFVRDLNLN